MRDAESRFADSTQSAGVVRWPLSGSPAGPSASRSRRGSGAPAVGRLQSLGLALVLGALAALLVTSPADAGTIHQFEAAFKLPGTNSRPGAMAIDEEAEVLYVLNTEGQRRGNLEKFDLAGNPVDFPGLPGPNESQTVHFEGSWASGNTFTLTCPNSETTAAILWPAEASPLQENIKSALEAKCGGTFSVESGPFNPVVHFEGTFAHTNVPRMTCTTVTGSGTCEIINEQDGSPETNAIRPACGGESSCSQIAVDNSGGANQGTIYVGSRSQGGHVQVYLPNGTNVGPIMNIPGDTVYGNEAPCGVAVDTDGNLYVTHAEGQISFTFVDRYAPLEWSTHPQQTVPATGTIRPLDFNNPCRTAIDSTKSLVISSGSEFYSSGDVHRFAPGAFGPPEPPYTAGTSTIITTGGREPAIDTADNNVYVGLTGKIARYDSTNSLVEEFGGGELSNEIGGTAVDGKTGKVYVSDGVFSGPKEVKVYKPVLVPDAITQDATGVLHSEATLHGHVDPAGAGEVTGCEFQYVRDSLYNSSKFASASSVPCEPAAPLNSATDVSAQLTNLVVEEGYHYRLRASNEKGTANGSVKAFMTRAVLDIKTEEATNVAPRSATLNGSFTGEGQPIEYFYEWGEDQSYGHSTPVQTLPNPSGAIAAPQALEGLELQTLYHYRIVATDSFGTSKGADMTFTTRPAVSGLETKPASSIDLENITLNAEFQGDGLDTHYYFEYGFTTEYGNVTPEVDAGVTNGPTPIVAEIDQFNGYLTYHYRVVAVNSFGETVGQDETFVAPNPLVPEIEDTTTVAVTPTTAKVSTEINPNHWETIYLFEWGTEPGHYDSATAFSEPFGGLDNEPIPIEDELTGLTPGSVYHFRAVAANFRGTTHGEDVTFITPAPPRVDSTFAGSVGKASAHLGGLVAARGSATRVSFQFGTSTDYGQSTPEVSIGEAKLTSSEVGADIGSLAPGTTYHFRIAASNAFGTTYGPDQTFTTEPEPPKPVVDCSRFEQQAKQLSSKAKRLRDKANSARGKRASVLRRQAKGASKQAAALRKKADACRSTSGGSVQ